MPPRRHPLMVTADRLREQYEQYFDLLSDRERDALGVIRNAFIEIAEGDR